MLHLDERDRRRHSLQRADHRAGVGVEQGIVAAGRIIARVLRGNPLRRQHAQPNMIFGCAARPSTINRLTRRTKIAGSSTPPPSASMAWSYSTWARSANAASSAVSLTGAT